MKRNFERLNAQQMYEDAVRDLAAPLLVVALIAGAVLIAVSII